MTKCRLAQRWDACVFYEPTITSVLLFWRELPWKTTPVFGSGGSGERSVGSAEYRWLIMTSPPGRVVVRYSDTLHCLMVPPWFIDICLGSASLKKTPDPHQGLISSSSSSSFALFYLLISAWNCPSCLGASWGQNKIATLNNHFLSSKNVACQWCFAEAKKKIKKRELRRRAV